jgi:hypothetical protein
MNLEFVLLVWFGARLTVFMASSLSVAVLWERRRVPVVGYQLLFWCGLLLTSGITAAVLLLSLAGVVADNTVWRQMVFLLSQIVIAPLAVFYSLALIGRMPPGPVRWLFGRPMVSENKGDER